MSCSLSSTSVPSVVTTNIGRITPCEEAVKVDAIASWLGSLGWIRKIFQILLYDYFYGSPFIIQVPPGYIMGPNYPLQLTFCTTLHVAIKLSGSVKVTEQVLVHWLLSVTVTV